MKEMAMALPIREGVSHIIISKLLIQKNVQFRCKVKIKIESLKRNLHDCQKCVDE